MNSDDYYKMNYVIIMKVMIIIDTASMSSPTQKMALHDSDVYIGPTQQDKIPGMWICRERVWLWVCLGKEWKKQIGIDESIGNWHSRNLTF